MNNNKKKHINKLFFRKTMSSILVAAFFIVIISFCLNLILIIHTDYLKQFYREHDRLNSEHNVFIFSSFDTNKLKNTLDIVLGKNDKVTEYELRDGISMQGQLNYLNGIYFNTLVFLKKNDVANCKVGRANIIEEDSKIDGIYLPYFFKTDDGFKIGDEVSIMTYDSTELKYNIAGFYYNSMYNSINCRITGLLLSDKCYDELYDRYEISDVLASVRVKNKNIDSFTIVNDIPNEVVNILPDAKCIEKNDYDLVSYNRNVFSIFDTAMLSATGIIILFISCVIIIFNLDNFIRKNLKMVGVLKAIGYTSKEIYNSMLFIFELANVISTIIGIMLTYLFFIKINKMFECETGLPYKIHFLWFPALVTVILVIVFFTFVLIYSLRGIRKIDPYLAITLPANARRGPLRKYSLEMLEYKLNTSISIANISTHIKQAGVIFVTTALTVIILTFSYIIMDNFIYDNEYLVRLTNGDYADISVVVSEIYEDKFKNFCENENNILNVVNMDEDSLQIEEPNARLMTFIIDDFSKITNKNWCVKGSFPNKSNEVCIGILFARLNNIKIGDIIKLKSSDKTYEFIVSGLSQNLRASQGGKSCLITRKGYEKFDKKYIHDYYIKLNDKKNIDDYMKHIEREVPVVMTMNMEKYYKGSFSSISITINTIIYMIMGVSFVIAIITLYQMTTMMLIARKKNYGIMKALGYTTKDLTIQTILSTATPAIAGLVFGTIAGPLIASPLFDVLLYFSKVSVMYVNFKPSKLVPVVAVVDFMMLFIMSFIVSRIYITSIDPQELITKE